MSNHQEGNNQVKICYVDESGFGEEPIAVMAGILIDITRMHKTKDEWRELLEKLSSIAGKHIPELHTKDLYSGNGIWRNVAANDRTLIADNITSWMVERSHSIVFTAVIKEKYWASMQSGRISDELNSIWRFLGFHLVLAIQKYGQRMSHCKGHTLLIFDNQHKEEVRFADVVLRPPLWSDGYYEREKKQKPLDQVVDVPYFADSRDVGLVQVADFVAFFLRRYAEVMEKVGRAPYEGEEGKLTPVVSKLAEMSLEKSYTYPSRNRDQGAELFYSHAPDSLRSLR